MGEVDVADVVAAEGKSLPKQSRPGVAWITARAPSNIHDAIRDLAEVEGRSLSNMTLRLVEEALKARGVDVSKPDIEQGETAGDE